MASIDKKDIENIESLQKILKSKNLNSVKIKKGEYEIEIALNGVISKTLLSIINTPEL